MIGYFHIAHKKTAQPAQSGFAMHTHDYYEILYFLSGDADYAVEGNVYRLHSGDMLIVRKAEAHRLVLRSDAPYERIVLNFDTDDEGLLQVFDRRPLGRHNLYKSAEIPEGRWRYYLEQICRYKDDVRREYYLLPLLNELNEHGVPESEGIRDRAQEIIAYINGHLGDRLSLDDICGRFYISKTHLNRIFQKSTGTTVWNYITVKRLFLARELISQGGKPTDVYAGAGFSDYTAFFRAYKKQFHEPPKAQKQSGTTRPANP